MNLWIIPPPKIFRFRKKNKKHLAILPLCPFCIFLGPGENLTQNPFEKWWEAVVVLSILTPEGAGQARVMGIKIRETARYHTKTLLQTCTSATKSMPFFGGRKCITPKFGIKQCDNLRTQLVSRPPQKKRISCSKAWQFRPVCVCQVWNGERPKTPSLQKTETNNKNPPART